MALQMRNVQAVLHDTATIDIAERRAFMFTLKIEHPIRDFPTWKAAFERDPIGRKQSGVRRYRVFRPTDDPKYVLIDLDFNQASEAQAFLEALRSVWSRVDLSPGLARDAGAASVSPKTRIIEEVDRGDY
jgi:hypothetical protein